MRYTWQAAVAIIQMFPINHLFFKTVTMCQQNMDFLIVMDTRLSKLRKREETHDLSAEERELLTMYCKCDNRTINHVKHTSDLKYSAHYGEFAIVAVWTEHF